MDNHELQFIEGFNSGYLLAKHKPDIASKLTDLLNPENDFCGGLISGKNEYELEKTRAQEKELLDIRNKSKERGKHLER